MTSQLPANNSNNSNYQRYLKIALSIAVIVFSAFAAALFGMGNDFSIAFLVVASACFAALLVVADYVHVAVLLGIGLIVSGILSRNVTAVLWSLAYMPSGWIIFYSLRKNAIRTTIVVRIAVFLGVFYAILIVGNLAAQYGNVSTVIVFGEIDYQIEAVAELFREAIVSVNINDPDAEVRAALIAEEFAINLRMMVPMIFAVYCLAIAYFITAFYRMLYNAVIGIRESRVIKRKDWRVHLSWVSALIMIMCSVVYMAVYADQSTSAILTSVIVSNIRFILTPGFCVMGIYFLFDKVYGGYNRYREPPSRFAPSLMLFGGCVFVLLFLQGAGIAMLAVFGIYAALIGEVKRIYNKAKKLITDDDGDDDEEEL